jgi:LmbE family N-acetylglucosaminyl deacetylase
MKDECDTLVLSPHLDDAVLSCSLRILQESKAGHCVKVATLFSSARPKLFGTDFYCGRRAEDKKALCELGVNDPIWLDFPDAIFRSPRYWSFSRIVAGENHDQFVDKVATRVCSLYSELAPKTVFLPLAVGTHIDHRCTFAMWNKLPSNANIVFYEDRPYSFLLNSVPLRLQDINATERQVQVDEEALMRSLSSHTMYRNVIKNEHERFLYVEYLTRKADEASQLHARAEKPFLNVKPEVIETTSTNEFEQIVKSITAYTSQTGMLYDNMKSFSNESDSYTRTLASSALYAERYWRLMR